MTGGGVAQTAAALYQAVRGLDCVRIDEMHSYGENYKGTYVASGEDAVMVDYNGGMDFSFTYLGTGRMSIYVHLNGSRLECEIYEEK